MFHIKITFFVVTAVFVSSQKIRGTTMDRDLQSYCTNSAPFEEMDEGCNADFPLCAKTDGHEPAANVAGDYCGSCRKVWNTDKVVDWGCTVEEPRCDAKLGLIGLRCLPAEVVPPPACKNTGAYGATDQNCTDENPICYNGKTQQEVGSYAAGTGCARCLNSFTSGFPDYGCKSAQPRCVMLNGTDAPLNKVGVMCCPAGGCPPCPCYKPNSAFYFALNDNAGSYACSQEGTILYGRSPAIYPWVGAGEYFPGVWVCGGDGAGFGYEAIWDITPEQGRACVGMIQAHCVP